MIVNEGNYQWRHSEGLLTFFPIQVDIPKKLAGFDLDGTLICPLPGRHQFDNDPNNWQWNYPNIVNKLEDLANLQYGLVIFTNQGGWSSKTIAKERSTNKLVRKLGNIMTALLSAGLKSLIYCALGKGSTALYRKPNPHMYEQFLIDMKIVRGPSEHGLQEQFFCGDAAGRAKDHSSCDLEFATNIGVCFFLPEQIFGGQTTATPPTFLHDYEENISEDVTVAPRNAREGVSEKVTVTPGSHSGATNHTLSDSFATKTKPSIAQELVLTVGYPGSGKTTYLKTHYLDYRIISQDVIKGQLKTSRPISQVLAEVKLALEQGLSVVVDRTNMTRDTRSPFLAMAYARNIPTKILWFNLDLDSSYARNATRDQKVSKIVYYKMRKEFEEPTLDESPNIIKIYQ